MTVLQEAVYGNQIPRLSLVPKYASNAVEEAVDLCEAYGLILDEWQITVLTAWLAEDALGFWAAPINGLSCPRQNGKGAVLEARELYGAVILGERILHTAHLLKTSKDHFKRMLVYVDNNAELAKMVSKIIRTNGEEAIEFKNGGVIKFVARSKNSGRGFTADLLVCDESQDMSDDDYAALQPTLFSVKNPQTILTGTPPIPSVDGTVWGRYRDIGLKAEATTVSWLEWSADKDDDFSDPKVWANANPALGYRGEISTIRNEYIAMDEETFCRERLGMWHAGGGAGLFDMETWGLLASDIDPTDPVAFAIDVSPERDMASIGVAGYLGEAIHVQIIDKRQGTGWVVQRMKELKEKWGPVAIVVDQGSPAASLIPDLTAARIRVTQTNATDMAQACGDFYDRVQNERILHANQPVLNEAVAVATKRPIRDAFAWNRKNPNADITPLVAVTLASFGLRQKRKPRTENKAAATPNRVRLLN